MCQINRCSYIKRGNLRSELLWKPRVKFIKTNSTELSYLVYVCKYA